MVNTCVIYGFHNRSDRGEVKRSYHAIPKVVLGQGETTKELSSKRRETWIAKMGRKDWMQSQYSKVCSDHFVTGKPSALYDQTHPDWAPSINLGHEKSESSVNEKSMKRYARTQGRQKKRVEATVAEALLDLGTLFEERDSSTTLQSGSVTFSLMGKLEKMDQKSETWSCYRHHNTVKFLIGITPQGVVSFLSKAWGGRASDKKITENCGLLLKLLPSDLVLADRGFDISESVGLVCAEVKIPAFTKGKSQLSPLEVETTRKIAHVRIHVERVIGLVRNKYTILQDTLHIDFLQSDCGKEPLVDDIVAVCCGLANLCESVVCFNEFNIGLMHCAYCMYY